MGPTYFVPGTRGIPGPWEQGETLPGGALRLGLGDLGDLEVFRDRERPHRAWAPGFRGSGGVKFRTSEAQESTGQRCSFQMTLKGLDIPAPNM